MKAPLVPTIATVPDEPVYTAEVLLTIRNKGDKFSLTDLWKLVGSPDKKTPTDWQNREATTELVEALCQILNTPKMGVLESKRGRRGGGTWAHKNLALSYAKWLDPKLHIAVNQAFLERLEEETNPELAIARGHERAIRKWKADGKSDKWIEERMQGVAQRKSFTSTLAQHGVGGQNGFRNCTNAIYTPLFGGTTEVVRAKKQLASKVSVRDNLSKLELGAVRLAELMAEETIDSRNLRGNAQCEIACTQAARSVAKAITENRRADLQLA